MITRPTRVSPPPAGLAALLIATLTATGFGRQQPPSQPDPGPGGNVGKAEAVGGGARKGQRGPRRPKVPLPPLQIITELAEVNPEYAMIGEYLGDIQSMSEHIRVGFQIAYAGPKTLRLQSYLGGLPGDGWDDRQTSRKGFGQLDGETLTFSTKPGPVTFVVHEGRIEALLNGQQIGWANKQERASPTLGNPPPAGADLLFDGSGLEQINGGSLDEGGLLLGPFSSKQSYQGHFVHMEFRLPYVPDRGPRQRGMNRVLIQGRYELLLQDSLGMMPSLKVCGAIVGADHPRINMSYPPLTWQTLEIDFRAARYDASGALTGPARASVFQNGVLIHEDVELSEASPLGFDLGPGPGPLAVSGDGCPVAYRNLWIKPTQ